MLTGAKALEACPPFLLSVPKVTPMKNISYCIILYALNALYFVAAEDYHFFIKIKDMPLY